MVAFARRFVLVAVCMLLVVALPVTAAVANPELADSCGVDMMLIMDSSSSIDETELATMQSAFKDFVDAFLPNTPTQIGVVEFDDTATITLDYTVHPVLVKHAIDDAVIGSFTNWQDALQKAHSLFDNRPAKPDLYVFASDGNPNRIGPGVRVFPDEALAAAIVEADIIKSDGVRIITLGIGNDLDLANLAAISSDDAVITSGFDTLANDLADLAEELCGGTITIRKFIDGQPEAGWDFTVNVTNGTAVNDTETTDQDGFAVFEINMNDDQSAIVDLSEIPLPGYYVENAFCSNGGTFDGNETITNITVGKTDLIFCEFHNSNATCGDFLINQPFEQCDMEAGVGLHQMCSDTCELINLTYCGDSILQTPNDENTGGPLDDGNEDCDDQDGVGEHQTCTQTCELVDLTYCGDGIQQVPNDEGTGGPQNDGNEACDNQDGVGNLQTCTLNCELIDLTYCGDGTLQTPNDLGTGGPQNDGNESCDIQDGIGLGQACDENCTILDVPFCGDDVINHDNEECDGQDGVGDGQACLNCQLVDLTFCGDSIQQAPNDFGTGGPLDDGNETCDGQDGIGPHQACTQTCELLNLTYCGDNIQQTPNDEGTGGTLNDGNEDCDGSAPEGFICTADCRQVSQRTCEDVLDDGLVYGTIDGSTATVYNNGDEPYTVSLASHEVYALLIEGVLFDSDTLIVQPHSSVDLEVTPPECAHQDYLVCGEPLPFIPLYGDRVINLSFSEGELCEPLQISSDVSVDVSVDEGYPQNRNYLFSCNATNFTPSAYYWYFGDGSILPNSPSNNVFHEYDENGNYTVACTATNGTVWQTGTLDIEIIYLGDQPVFGVPHVDVFPVQGYPVMNNHMLICNATNFTPTNYEWNFGDGSAAINLSGNEVSYNFTENGDFLVTCTASNSLASESGSLPVSNDACKNYTITINSTSPDPILPGDKVTVTGTLERDDRPTDLSGETVFVNGRAVGVLMNQWATVLSPPGAGVFDITATYVSVCEDQFTDAVRTDVGPALISTRSGGGGPCTSILCGPGSGTGGENGGEGNGDGSGDGGDNGDGSGDGNGDGSGDDTVTGGASANVAAPNDPETSTTEEPVVENLITGAVTGGAIDTWLWLLSLLGLGVIGFAAYTFTLSSGKR